MAALSATVPTNAGTASPGAAVAASDTIAQSIMGSIGGILEILNGGGSSDTVTVSDNGQTAAGNQLTGNSISAAVANGTNKVFYIRNPGNVNPSTGVCTITHSFITSVTYKFYPVP